MHSVRLALYPFQAHSMLRDAVTQASNFLHLDHFKMSPPSSLPDRLPPQLRAIVRDSHKKLFSALIDTRHNLDAFRTQVYVFHSNLRRGIISVARRSSLTNSISDDYINGCVDAITAAVVLSAGVWGLRRATTRFATAEDIPISLIQRQAKLHGSVVAVRDGDNLRIRHMPLVPRVLNRYMKPRPSNISTHTINVRLAAVDAPECAHGLLPAQPHAVAARTWLQSFATGSRVTFRLHSMDQYRRIVATVHRKNPNPLLAAFRLGTKNIGLELVRAGYATVYYGRGAQYGGSRLMRRYMRMEAIAKQAQRGMWAPSSTPFMSPKEYKQSVRMGNLNELRARLGINKASEAPTASSQQKQKDKDEISLLTRVLQVAMEGYLYLKRFR